MFLDRIVAVKQQEVEALAQCFSIQQIEREIAELPACRDFHGSLAVGRKRPLGLIAEVKKASPSKGLIRPDIDPAAIARAYEEAGSDCLSVLTDEPFFQGSNEVLKLVRRTVDVPILRKDFTIDYRQIYEARVIGADAVLLIAAILTNAQMKEFLALAKDLGLTALVEVHDREELERALELDAKLVGINNRNLHTFVTDLKTTEQLISLIPSDRTIVSESGIASPADAAYLAGIGAQAVLVGEHFMRQPDVGAAVRELFSALPAVASERENAR
ncbi:MAG: Indole-3-glycerol-phosphate synthase [Paenibacillaceae bacterium]|jgi:indole-3-glycerol phosphate synthase|nr:Indole-3-glycerol-phosphate synthase [Paenibacillaceae bacterium]